MTRQLAHTAVGLASLFALALTGCCLFSQRSSPAEPRRCGAGLPVLGQPAQYTLAPGPRDGALVRPVYLCTNSPRAQAHHRIPVQGLGWRRFHTKARGGCKQLPAASSEKSPVLACIEINLHAFLQDVHRGLKAAGVVNTGLGLTPCCGGLRDAQGRFRGVSIRIRHWQYAEAAVRVVAQKVRQWGLAQTVSVLVAPIPGACPL